MKPMILGMLGALFINISLVTTSQALNLQQLTPTGNAVDIPTTNQGEQKPKTVKPAFRTVAAGSGCSAMNPAVLHQKASPHLGSITQYAQQYGVDSNIVKAVIAVESCYNAGAVSPKNAQGLMQLIPETAARFGISNAFDSNQNIRGGTRYLSWLLNRYNGDMQKAIAAYNAGEGAVDKYAGIPPYNETQHYVQRVLTIYNRLSDQNVPIPAVVAQKKQGKRTANGTQVIQASTANTTDAIDTGGRVSMTYNTPVAKPGRGGWANTRALAPQLFKQK